MKNIFRFRLSLTLIIFIQIQCLLFSSGASLWAEGFSNYPDMPRTMLSPRISVNANNFHFLYQQVISSVVPLAQFSHQNLFTVSEERLQDPQNNAFIQQLQMLNILYQNEGSDAVIQCVLDNPELMQRIFPIIQAQDRMADTRGYFIDHFWAEALKHEALKQAASKLKGYDFIFTQMEYELSAEFLKNFKNHLKSKGLNEEEAIYATGQLAKLQMAGGLGSFKPDLVRAYFDVLKKFWGAIEAKNRLHSLGVFYTKAIRGEGELIKDKRLDEIDWKLKEVRHKQERESVVRNLSQAMDGLNEIREDMRFQGSMLQARVRRIEIISAKQTRDEMVEALQDLVVRDSDIDKVKASLSDFEAAKFWELQNIIKNILKRFGQDDPYIHELVYVALDAMAYVTELQNVPINTEGMGTEKVQLYRDPYSDKLNEYWAVNPMAFHEAYPGEANDHFRPIQTFVYKEVLMRLLYLLSQRKFIGDKLILSSSEVSTALANLNTIDTNLESYPEEARPLLKKIFGYLKVIDKIDHLYNHTIVPEGMSGPPSQLFNPKTVKLSPEFWNINHAIFTDLRLLTTLTNDIITGCSDAHSNICKENPGLYKDVSYKFMIDSLFGNTEGSDIERWQGDDIKKVIGNYMDILINQGDLDKELIEKYVSPYPLFFLALTHEKNFALLDCFKQDMAQAKQKQKQRFIDALKNGVFASWSNGINEHKAQIDLLEQNNIELINRPFFTFVRRMVTYKCVNNIVDTIVDAERGDADFQAQQRLKELQKQTDEQVKVEIEHLIKQLENPGTRERIIRSKAIIFIGGRDFDNWGHNQHNRLKAVMEKDKRLYEHVFFVDDHNVATSYLIQQGTDFGGMLSWRGKEAGPTSPSNSGLNWTIKFGTQDGMLEERLIPVERDEKTGKIIKGTGYKVDYVENQVIPDMSSFVKQMEQACRAYYDRKDYDAVAFNNLWLEMTQGDIRNQVSGLLMIYANHLEKRQQRQKYWSDTIEKFVRSIGKETFDEILKSGRNSVEKFKFKAGKELVARNAGLAGLLRTLKINAQHGMVYNTGYFEQYIKDLIANLPNRVGIYAILEGINTSAMIPYEKQKISIEFIEMLVERLKRGKHYSSLRINLMDNQDIDAVESFAWSLDANAIQVLLDNGEKIMRPFGFGIDGVKEPDNAGLRAFVKVLEEIDDKGKVYGAQQNFIAYLEGSLANLSSKKNQASLVSVLQNIQQSEKSLEDKQKEFIAFFKLLVERLEYIQNALYKNDVLEACSAPLFPVTAVETSI